MFNFREMSHDLRYSHTVIPFKYNTIHHEKKSIRCVVAKLCNMLSNELVLNDLLRYSKGQTEYVLIVNFVL